MNSDSSAGVTAGRPARSDEVEPSEAMRQADRANGEPDAASDDDRGAARRGPATPDPDVDERTDHGSTRMTDDPSPPGQPSADEGDQNR